MGKSFKKTPIFGYSTSASDKSFKKQEHQRRRAFDRGILQQMSIDNAAYLEDFVSSEKQFGNTWASNKDGKMYLDIDKYAHSDPGTYEFFKKYLRK